MKALKITSTLAAIALASATFGKTFNEVTAEAKAELRAAQDELANLRRQIADQKVPISQRLTQLESEVLTERSEFNRVVSTVENKEESLRQLQDDVKRRNDENVYLKNTMGAYLAQFMTRVHAAEIQKYEDLTEKANQIVENPNLPDSEKLTAQLEIVALSLKRVKNIMGGAIIDGDALGEGGRQVTGRYVVAGPFAVFSDGTENIGFARGDQNAPRYPILIGEDRGVSSEEIEAIVNITESGSGNFPVDATEGDAIKFALTKESTWEHIKKGGVTMVPLLGIAFIALLIAVFKFFEIKSVKSPRVGTLQRILDSLNSGNKQQALEAANSVDGPFGDLLVAGVEHADDEKELLEEVLYERLLAAQPKLERFIAFIALTAGAAPLLGLLGTVTGMINTFKLITVFGTGDAKSLSSGISEALITTQYGLYVAIPSLLLQALLSRMAKGKLGEMEQAAVAFVNGLRK